MIIGRCGALVAAFTGVAPPDISVFEAEDPQDKKVILPYPFEDATGFFPDFDELERTTQDTGRSAPVGRFMVVLALARFASPGHEKQPVGLFHEKYSANKLI